MNVETFKETLEGLDNQHLNAIMIHPKHISKWEWFLDGFRNINYILDSYNMIEHFPDDFWEGLSWGWYQEYIYPYDDDYNPTISPERKLRLGQ